MEHRRQKHETWVSVPQFGGWDLRGVVPGYGAEFSDISETRKQNKRDASRPSVGTEAELSLSITTTKPTKPRHKGAISSATQGKPSQAKRNNRMSPQLKTKPNNPKGEVSSGQKYEPTKGKPIQAKPSTGVSSGPKNETANPKPTGGVSSPLNIQPTKARSSGRVSSRSKNKQSTTVSYQRSSSILSHFNCCTKP